MCYVYPCKFKTCICRVILLCTAACATVTSALLGCCWTWNCRIVCSTCSCRVTRPSTAACLSAALMPVWHVYVRHVLQGIASFCDSASHGNHDSLCLLITQKRVMFVLNLFLQGYIAIHYCMSHGNFDIMLGVEMYDVCVKPVFTW